MIQRTDQVIQHRIPIKPWVDDRTEFPHNEVADRLDDVKRASDHTADLAVALREVFVWIAEARKSGKKMNGKQKVNAVGTRCLALMWAIDPGLMDGISLRALADDSDLNRARLAELSGEASRLLGGHRNRGQAHAHNWKPKLPPHSQN